MVTLLKMVQRISTQTSTDDVYDELSSAIEKLVPFRDIVLLRHVPNAEHKFVAVQHRWHDGVKRGKGGDRKIRVNRAFIELCQAECESLVHEPADGGELVLLAPIHAQNKVLGVTYVRAREFVDPEVSLDLLTSLSRQAGLILERCELVAAAQRQRSRMERAHQVLGHEEAMLRALLDGLGEGVILARQSGIVILSNKRGDQCMAAMCARSERSGRIRRIGGVRFKTIIEPLKRGQAVLTEELKVDGDPVRHYQLSISSVPLGRYGDVGESGFCLSFRDVTDQQTAREQLIQAEKLSGLGEMISGIAHELNNPLFSILGYAELLQGTPGLPTDARDDLGRLERQAERCSKIVGNLLTFGRKHPPKRSLVQVNELIGSVVDLMSYKAKVRDIRLHVLSGDLPLTFADGHQLEQVLLNLVHNAYQAISALGRPGVITLRSRVDDAGYIEVRVLDDGPGISPEHQRRLFDPFFTTKKVGEGTGLGLSVSYGIMREHAGTISVDSELGDGACFVLRLPVTSSIGTRPGTETAEAKAARTPKLAILIVDDENEIVSLLTRALSQMGHRCTGTQSAREALDLAKREHFDCMLCDMQMPEMNGRALLTEIKSAGLKLSKNVVLMTGDVLNADTTAFVEQYGCHKLAKPFKLSILPQVLEAVMSGSSSVTAGLL